MRFVAPVVLWAALVSAADTTPSSRPGSEPEPPHDEPHAIPSGFDLLYGDNIAFTPAGEPLVTVGIATGEKRVRLRAKTPLELDFWESGVLKRATVKPSETVEVVVARATASARQYYLDLEGAQFGDTAAVERALTAWRKRGYDRVAVMEEGIVLGMHGRVLDNREYRIVLNAKSRADAERQSALLFTRHGTRAEVKARLTERPWGELKVRANGTPLGVATSYVRVVSPSGLVQIDQVEFGRGYSWHGRENRSYHGEIYVAVNPQGALAVVNVLGAEQLLEGVVPAELYASSPVEALKAQAVAARNHLLSQLGRRHHDDPFHLCSEQHCQVYAGTSREDPRASAAVRATSGLALFHGNRLVECAYSASCGGHTEDNDIVWGNPADAALRGRPDFDIAAHPELARYSGAIDPALVPSWIATVPDSYCARGAAGHGDRIRWSRRLTAEDLGQMLAEKFESIGELRDLVVEQRGTGGRILALRIVGTRDSATLVHELTIRRLFGNLSSGAFVFDIERDDHGAIKAIRFTGAGWGHGVGMCQLGAVGRALAGHTYEQILGHYYSGAKVEKLY